MPSLTAAEADEVNWKCRTGQSRSLLWPISPSAALCHVRDYLNEDERPMLDYYKEISLREKIYYIILISYFYI